MNKFQRINLNGITFSKFIIEFARRKKLSSNINLNIPIAEDNKKNDSDQDKYNEEFNKQVVSELLHLNALLYKFDADVLTLNKKNRSNIKQYKIRSRKLFGFFTKLLKRYTNHNE